MNHVTISVTRRHIREARNSTDNPVILALKEIYEVLTDEAPNVACPLTETGDRYLAITRLIKPKTGPRGAVYQPPTIRMIASLKAPRSVARFLDRFEDNKPVQPFSFRLTTS